MHLLAVLLVALLLTPSSAFAYLDPGAGSMLAQGVFAGVAGALVVVQMLLRNWVRRARQSFSKKQRSDPA